MYQGVYFTGGSYYGENCGGYFFLPEGFDNYELILALKEYLIGNYGWYERAGKHSYTEVETADFVKDITFLNESELSDSSNAIESLYDYFFEKYGEEYADELVNYSQSVITELSKMESHLVIKDKEAISKEDLNKILETHGWKIL